jgi:hypothetical protein
VVQDRTAATTNRGTNTPRILILCGLDGEKIRGHENAPCLVPASHRIFPDAIDRKKAPEGDIQPESRAFGFILLWKTNTLARAVSGRRRTSGTFKNKKGSRADPSLEPL